MGVYKLHPKAELDLENIWLYTLYHWGVEQADKYIDDLDVTFRLLAEQPLSCRERSEFSPPVRIHHHAHHLVVYRTAHNFISIIRVLHEGMDIDEQLSAPGRFE